MYVFESANAFSASAPDFAFTFCAKNFSFASSIGIIVTAPVFIFDPVLEDVIPLFPQFAILGTRRQQLHIHAAGFRIDPKTWRQLNTRLRRKMLFFAHRHRIGRAGIFLRIVF